MFSKVASAIDDIPISKGNSSNVSDIGFEVLTPNRLKLGRNNFRSLHGSIDLSGKNLPSALLSRNRKLTSAFMQTMIDRAHHFQHKPNKWLKSDPPPKVDDVVLFVFTDGGKGQDSSKSWKVGRIISVSGGRTRIMYPSKSKPGQIPTLKIVERSFREVSILFSEEDLYINSKSYHDQLCQIKESTTCSE